ncbi:toxin-antitoxin system TumE family protein [Haloferax marisrubri]|uniref:Sugar metabolism cluster protein n=1 Tax=Haloferax marisrubri TaxID=1544719 RepID=A0A2P4NM18_9EURY|nr:DUF6516 family protein [Haloferax marisrubri]POG54148.1 hypothetical protein AUR65_015870 [Haloferax marisrubri]
MAGNGAKRIIDQTIDYPESDRFAHISVWSVPESEAYPEGIKYSMHYGNKAGDTILRYDNAHPETKGHERHVGEDIDGDYEYPGSYVEVLQRFRREVNEYEQD